MLSLLFCPLLNCLIMWNINKLASWKKNKYREILQANHKPWCGLWWWSILFFCFSFVLLTQYLQWYKKNRSFLYLIEKNYSHTHIQGGGPDICYLIKETHIMTIFCPFYPNWITTAGDCEKNSILIP